MSDGPVFRGLPSPRSSPRSSTRPTCCRAVRFSTCQRTARGRPYAGALAGRCRRAAGDRDRGRALIVLGAATHFYGAATSRDPRPDQQQEPMARRRRDPRGRKGERERVRHRQCGSGRPNDHHRAGCRRRQPRSYIFVDPSGQACKSSITDARWPPACGSSAGFAVASTSRSAP